MFFFSCFCFPLLFCEFMNVLTGHCWLSLLQRNSHSLLLLKTSNCTEAVPPIHLFLLKRENFVRAPNNLSVFERHHMYKCQINNWVQYISQAKTWFLLAKLPMGMNTCVFLVKFFYAFPSMLDLTPQSSVHPSPISSQLFFPLAPSCYNLWRA